MGLRTVVLVEGVSDQVALQTLAVRRGRDLDADGVAVLPMGGATNVGRFTARYGPGGAGLRLAGMGDVAEERHFRGALQRAGVDVGSSRTQLEERGFFFCDVDLEDELIRSLGAAAVERVLDEAGELGLFRRFQHQPAQRNRTRPHQLRRFLGTRSGRKIEYARLLVTNLDLDRVPRPLDGVLGHL